MIVPTTSLLEIYTRRWPDGIKTTIGGRRLLEQPRDVRRVVLQSALRALFDEAERQGFAPADLFDAMPRKTA